MPVVNNSEGWGRRITWVQEFKTSLGNIDCDPGSKSTSTINVGDKLKLHTKKKMYDFHRHDK
jgi:hypothetical protein